MDKFFVDARILYYSIFDEANREALIRILPSNHIIECFVNMFQSPHFEALKHGDRIHAELDLTISRVAKSKKRAKKFMQEDHVLNSNKTSLTGQIVHAEEIKDRPEFIDYVIDCGFTVFLRCEKEKHRLVKGEWINAEGELDVYFHELYQTRSPNLDDSVLYVSNISERGHELTIGEIEIDETFMHGRKRRKT